jgi:hypothetical protein
VAEPPPASGHGGLVLPVLLLVVASGAAVWWYKRPQPKGPTQWPRVVAAGPNKPQPTPEDVPIPTPPPTLVPVTTPTVQAGQLPEADRIMANTLAGRVNIGAPLGAADVQSAEELAARHVGDPALQSLLGAVRMTAGHAAFSKHVLAEALAHYRRAAEVLPGQTAPVLAQMNVLEEMGDWPGGEAAARAVLAVDANRVDAMVGLAVALFRQDRNREAADVLKSSLAVRETAEARALLARIQKGLADESGMTEQRLSHFNVRYDGETHEDVGREVLRALERHYATLVVSLDHQPQATIPVILFSQQQYFDAAGAPAWSGGVYDNIDGRIRIPIGGLTASLTPDMDGTLIHEVTHAFIADRTRGTATREIHEGLAQFMEGKRLTSLLDTDRLRMLADGQVQGVLGFYLQALSFVEYLMAQRGQGGMNDVLKAMGESGDVNDAFRRVYGQDYQATRRAWTQRVRQQYGS